MARNVAEARVLEPHETRAPDAPSSTRFPFPQYTGYDGGSDLEYDELDLRRLQSLRGGESRSGQLTGTKALMLAVLEDGIRSYLGRARSVAAEADYWINCYQRNSPFSFIVICETLGLDPQAVRTALARMKDANVSGRRAVPRSLNNVRVPGRVCLRRRTRRRTTR